MHMFGYMHDRQKKTIKKALLGNKTNLINFATLLNHSFSKKASNGDEKI